MAADKLNGARKYVVSKTLAKADWENSTLIKNDAMKEIAGLKEQKGPEIQVHGSGGLIQSLQKNNLIDECHVWIFPVALGTGKRLFGDGTIPSAFKLWTARHRRRVSSSLVMRETEVPRPVPSR